ncbi:hypothetical protein OFC63_35995, partial [Escherichia coli]|nr:hypothetical protein [Escherichia coli]
RRFCKAARAMPIGPPIEFDETPSPAFELGEIVEVLVVFKLTQQITLTVVPQVPVCVLGFVETPLASVTGPR